jgi:hypothetical protein
MGIVRGAGMPRFRRAGMLRAGARPASGPAAEARTAARTCRFSKMQAAIDTPGNHHSYHSAADPATPAAGRPPEAVRAEPASRYPPRHARRTSWRAWAAEGPVTSSIRTSIPLACACLVFALGCNAYQGSRLYASGSEALDRGNPELAVAELEKAAELLPDASPVQNHLGLAYAETGRDVEAEAAFRRAVELDCSNDAAQHNLRAAEAGRLRPPEGSHVP